MLVEFIGSTGAGKSTTLEGVKNALAKRTRCTTSADIATGLVGMGWVSNPTAQNLIQEAVGLPFFLSSLYRNRAFLACTMGLLLRQLRLNVTTINNLRSLERKLGTYALAKWLARDRIVLVDEGPTLAAHMFVRGSSYTADDLVTFAKTVPLPDLMVYVKAPVDEMVARTIFRPDPPREMASHSPIEMARYAEAAANLFERLVEQLKGSVPILTVYNPDMEDDSRAIVVDTIVTFILSGKAGSNVDTPAVLVS